jgi:hypothetical protein
MHVKCVYGPRQVQAGLHSMVDHQAVRQVAHQRSHSNMHLQVTCVYGPRQVQGGGWAAQHDGSPGGGSGCPPAAQPQQHAFAVKGKRRAAQHVATSK